MKPLLIDASFARDCSTDKISAFPLETRSMRLLYLTVYVPSSFFSLDIRPDALNKLGNNLVRYDANPIHGLDSTLSNKNHINFYEISR